MYIYLRKELSLELLDGNSEGKMIYYWDGSDAPLDYFGPLSDVNIFVGANNSGKSRFLRGLLKQQKLSEYLEKEINFFKKELSKISTAIIEKAGASLSYTIISGALKHILPEAEKIFTGKNKFPLEIAINADYFKSIADFLLNKFAIITEQKNLDEIKKFLDQKITEILLLIYIGECFQNPNKSEKTRAISGSRSNNYIRFPSNAHLIKNFIPDLTEYIKYIGDFKDKFKINEITPSERIYFPILRSSSSLYNFKGASLSHVTPTKYMEFEKIDKNIFEYSAFKNYLFHEQHYNHIKVRINTGLELYKEIKKIRNSRKEKRKNFDSFERFLKENFFNNKDVEIITLDTENNIEQHISVFIDGEERDIHDLGDGIQSIILIMYSVFTAEQGAWIFIEEPEIHLHPGLQRVLLDQITNNPILKKKKLKYFMTTHSNHLLDISLTKDKGISIFTFEKLQKNEKKIFRIKNVKNSDTDILRKLEVNNSSVFIANCSIWIEGITDRKYLKAFLREYCKHNNLDSNSYKEDIHYAFFEYAGSNIAHYLFYNKDEIDGNFEIDKDAMEKIQAQFLSNKIFLIADKDKNKDTKHSLLGIQANKNFHYEVLPVLELENLLSSNHLKIILPKLTHKLTGDIVENANIDARSFKSEYLGKYLTKEVFKKNDFPNFFITRSGTLSPYYKMKLADLVVDSLTWDLMSEPAKELSGRIYEFIQRSN